MQHQASQEKNKVSAVTKMRLVKIGKSWCVRLSRQLLDKAEIDEEIELEAQDGQIIIRPVPVPRRDWEKHFGTMASRGDDRLLDAKLFSLTSWDDGKWVW